MKKIIVISAVLFFSTLFLFSCQNVKIEDDYYYEETDRIDGWDITLTGKGYGVYGQMLDKYKTGSIAELMSGSPMIIETSSADDNNALYNEIYLTFEKNCYVKSFETDVSALKEQGLYDIRVFYKDDKDYEYTLSSKKYPFTGVIEVEKDVRSITLFIKAYKFYPNAYSSLQFKGDMEEEDFEKKELNGKQVDNKITINYVKIGE